MCYLKRHFLPEEFLLYLFQCPKSALKQCFFPGPCVEGAAQFVWTLRKPAATGAALLNAKNLQVVHRCPRMGRRLCLLSSTAVWWEQQRWQKQKQKVWLVISAFYSGLVILQSGFWEQWDGLFFPVPSWIWNKRNCPEVSSWTDHIFRVASCSADTGEVSTDLFFKSSLDLYFWTEFFLFTEISASVGTAPSDWSKRSWEISSLPLSSPSPHFFHVSRFKYFGFGHTSPWYMYKDFFWCLLLLRICSMFPPAIKDTYFRRLSKGPGMN